MKNSKLVRVSMETYEKVHLVRERMQAAARSACLPIIPFSDGQCLDYALGTTLSLPEVQPMEVHASKKGRTAR